MSYTEIKIKETFMVDIKYEIVKHIAVLAEGSKGWKKELNLISWNDKELKFNIRGWASEHANRGKGVTLSKNAAITKFKDGIEI